MTPLPPGYSITTGTVLKTTKENITNIQTKGGGGVVVDGFGVVSPSRVYSTNTVKQDIWLETSQGEQHYWLRNYDIPIREGQVLTFGFVNNQMVFLINHNTQERHRLLSGKDVFPPSKGFHWIVWLAGIILMLWPFLILWRLGQTIVLRWTPFSNQKLV